MTLRVALLFLMIRPALAQDLSPRDASRFAQLTLKCVGREYPNKPDHVMADATDVRSPKTMHPAFYGCYDWHSSVHGHWLLAHLLKQFPGLPEGAEIRSVLDENLSTGNIEAELAYLTAPERKSFERTYGWAWLLKLAAQLHANPDEDSQRWFASLKPLAEAVAARYEEFLPKQTYSIRTGVHANTAFGIAFAWDYAVEVHDTKLEGLLSERARAYYEKDAGYPASWEPSGEDFFSPALMEADLMRRVMGPKEFAAWFHKFLPALTPNLLAPAAVTDRTDPKLVHLDGLNLSRAWCMRSIAAALPEKDPARKILTEAAARHLQDALARVFTGHYEGEHWLATFAAYALSNGGD